MPCCCRYLSSTSVFLAPCLSRAWWWCDGAAVSLGRAQPWERATACCSRASHWCSTTPQDSRQTHRRGNGRVAALGAKRHVYVKGKEGSVCS